MEHTETHEKVWFRGGKVRGLGLWHMAGVVDTLEHTETHDKVWFRGRQVRLHVIKYDLEAGKLRD